MSQKTGRNDPCPCGSGKKFKACCWKKMQETSKKTFTAKPIAKTGASIGKTFSKILPPKPEKSEENP